MSAQSSQHDRLDVIGRPRSMSGGPVGPMDDFEFGVVWKRPGLSRKERRLVAIAALAAADSPSALGDHVYGALSSGDITIDELTEVAFHVAIYAGWPKGERLDEAMRDAWQAIEGGEGEAAKDLPSAWQRNETLSGEELDQHNATVFKDVMTFDPPPPFSPYTSAGVLGLVFGQLWDRPGLTWRERRFVTLPCVNAGAAVGPIESHIYAALNSGDLTFAETQEVVLQCAVYTGWPRASRFEQSVMEQWGRIESDGGPAGKG